MTGEDMLAACERLVEKALARGADQAETYATRSEELEVDLERDRIAFTGTSRTRGGSVRIVQEGRVGFAYFTEEPDAEAAIQRALANARLAPAKGYSLPAGGPTPGLPDRFDDRLAAMEVDDAVGMAKDVLASAKEACPDAVVAGGGASLGLGWEALASSEGVRVHDGATHLSLSASLVLGESGAAVAHWDHRLSHRMDQDPAELGRAAADVVVALRGPKPAEATGRLDVVFRPDAVSELLTDLVVHMAVGDDALRGKTAWSHRLGQAMGDSRLTVADDPLHPQAVGVAPFDGEGLAARRVPILEDGVLCNYLFDSRDAHEHGRASTHSAVRSGFKNPPDTGSHHVVVEAPGVQSEESLVASIDDGVLVGSLLGAHTANVTTGDFSVTAPNVWRIRGGEVVGPATEVALAGNLTDLLRRFDGLGDAPKRLHGALVPVMLFRGLDISS